MKDLKEKIIILSSKQISAIMQIIIVLSERKELLSSELQRNIKASNETYYKARKILVENDLIYQKIYEFAPNNPWCLTEKGNKAVESIKLFIPILYGD